MLSRVADSLYWMSRYLERAEHMARLAAMRLTAAIEQRPKDAAADWRLIFHALHLEMRDADDAKSLMDHFILDRVDAASMSGCIQAARDNARQVREHISGEMWEQLNRHYLGLRRLRIEAIWSDEPVEFLNNQIDALLLLRGLADDTLSHGEAWHFIELGRFLERAQSVARLTDLYLARGEFDAAALLKMVAAFEAYCRVNTAVIRTAAVLDFLILDPHFPHSIRFCADAIQAHLGAIAPKSSGGRRAKPERIAGRLVSVLDDAEAENLLITGPHAFLDQIQDLAEAIHDQVYAGAIDYPIPAHLNDG